MEHEHRTAASPSMRRRRRIGRPAATREKTPDVSHRRVSYEDDSSYAADGNTASEDTAAQTVSMQIRPPRTMSAHESKILRRRDKTFATTASRSLSQPRQAERLSEPEATELIRTVKRSLSMPRNKELVESSDGEALGRERTLSPEARLISQPIQPVADENLSRLQQNLRRFEDERKRFDAEKRIFEREKRDHKMRYKQMMDNEERKRLVQSYRKLSDRIKLPQDAEERRRLIHSLRLDRKEVALPKQKPRSRHSGGYDESSTQFSSSDAETGVEEQKAKILAKNLSPVRRHNSAMATASVRGPPPEPPARKSVSRNSSLSPIRPERRSRTPEQIAEAVRKRSLREASLTREEDELATERRQQRKQTQEVTTTEMESEKEIQLRQRRARRSESLTRPKSRRQSLEMQEKLIKRKSSISQDKVDGKSKAQNKELEDVVVTKAETVELQAEEETKKPKKATLLERILKLIFKKTETKQSQIPEALKAEQKEVLIPKPPAEIAIPDKIISVAFLRAFLADARWQWRKIKSDHPKELEDIRKMRNKCFAHAIMLALLIGFGGLMFRYTEGAAENIYKCEVRKVKRDFIDTLWSNSHNMREDDWKTLARAKLRNFEAELHNMGELGIRYFPGQKSWNFVNCILYCWTVITTIGYGHITPKTTLGRSLTIVYAIIGIPMFLILLADFGKLFTRVIKFVWGYVRRLYYTGTCRKFRKQQQYKDAMTGFSTVYDMAIRKPSNFFGITDADVESQGTEANNTMGNSHPETPTSPYPDTIVVDDEFNLPITLASILLITYILLGAFVYTLWEDWTYFEAFYFVFISMSTIGFGDLVPNHPIFMMCSIIYLVFGLALTSMFINVVQIKLSDTFKNASTKIGATMGFGMASEAGDLEGSHIKTPSELASIHGSRLGKIDENDENNRTPSGLLLPPVLRTQAAAAPVPPRPRSPNDVESSDIEMGPPPLLPRRQVSVEEPAADKKKKKRFFK